VAGAEGKVTARRAATAAGLFLLALFLGSRGIDADVYQGGEAREALVAREMLTSGDWVLPLWNGSVVPSKPPMFHWFVASGARLTGGQVSPRALRAPSTVLAAVVVVLVYVAGVAWAGERTGAFAGLVLATTPQFLREAGNGRVDMTLLAGVVAAQIALAAAWRRGGARGVPGVVVALALAWAMLAKGPVGPAVVGMTAAAFAWRQHDVRTLLRLVRPMPVLVFLVLAGGWYAAAYLHRGTAFFAKQILSENGEALLGGARIPYRSPLFFLVPLVLGGLPWTLLLPWALRSAWRGAPERRQCLVWAAVVFVFFSLAPLKRVAYILPLRPPLALLTGWWLAEAVEAVAAGGVLVGVGRVFAWIVGLLAAGAGVATELALRGHVPARLRALATRDDVDLDSAVRALAASRWETLALLAGTVAAAMWTARALGRARWTQAVLGTAAMVALGTTLGGDVVAPERAAQRSVQPFARAVALAVPPDGPLTVVASSDVIPFLFYVGRHVPLERAGAAGLGAGWHVLHRGRWERLRARVDCAERARGDLHSAHLDDLVLVRCEGLHQAEEAVGQRERARGPDHEAAPPDAPSVDDDGDGLEDDGDL
jgi:hypothetical protein